MEAESLLGYAETAYAWEVTQQGFPEPLNDGDGKTDIYVSAAWPMLGGAAAYPDSTADQTTGSILLSPANARSLYPVAHELFHVIQFGIYQHAGFFTESTAEWAGQATIAANGASPPPNWFGDPQVSLDCVSATCGGGYRGSIFWEYLFERFGARIVLEAYERDAALAAAAGDHGPHDVQALGEVLAARGSSLAAALEGYAQAAVAGQITRPGVLPYAPVAEQALIAESPGEFVPYTTTVDHLAMKVIAFFGAADAFSTAPCTPVTLGLRVSFPAGLPTAPVFVTYPPDGQPPATGVYPLAIAGDTASAEIPWATCAASVGALALPNASTGTDAQPFGVQMTVTSSETERQRLRRPRLSGRRLQRARRLTIRIHSATAVKAVARATVRLPHRHGALTSRTVRRRIAAGRTATVRLHFAPKRLKAIEAALRSGAHLRAEVRVSAHDAAGQTATATRTIRLKR